jgi:hypothetical protein
MAYTLAQAPAVANSASGTSVSKAFASTVTAHSLLVAVVTTSTGGGGTYTITGGGTWVVRPFFTVAAFTQNIMIGYCLDATGGTAPTVQASWSTSTTFNAISIGEFTNGGVASLFDAGTAGTAATSTNPTDTAMSATAADAVVSYAIGGSSTPTVGATFTIGASDSTDLAAWEYKILAGSGSTTGVFASASQQWGIMSACFKPAGAAAAVRPRSTRRPARPRPKPARARYG